MKHLARILLCAVLVTALLASSAFAMQDMSKDHDMHKTDDHAGHMATPEKQEPMDHSGHDMNSMKEEMDHSEMDHEGMDHENMDMSAEEHDHEAMMEQAGKEVGIEERLGNIIADVSFVDGDGNKVNLRELTKDVPTILIPIYYRCPDICNMMQGAMAATLPDVALKPGEEYQVVSISFDPREGAKDAARAKKTYIAATQGGFPGEHWTFLAADGDTKAINAWLDSIGYTVKREGGLYAHPAAVLAIAPGGKVVRYLYGTQFLPFDITMAGSEAATGKIGMSIKRMLSFCYNYDPQGRRYVFSILRVSGFAIVGFVGIFIAYLVLSGRKQKKKKA